MKELIILFILLITLALISCSPTGPEREEWKAVDMGQITTSPDDRVGGQLIIADLRQDGITRLYCLVIKSFFYSIIYEFSYSNNSWTKIRIDSAGLDFHSIEIGRCKNDGILRLYGVSSDKVSEFNFTNNQWTIQDISSFSGGNLAIGDPKNDGFESLYMFGYEAGYGGIYEISFRNMVWERTFVDTVKSLQDISVGNGRGDGNESIYITNLKTDVFELRYENGFWNRSILGQLMSLPPNTVINTVVEVTNTHNGQPAVYASTARTGGELFEFFFDNDQWTKIRLGEEPGINQIRGGIGRNDGINRLYCSVNFDILAEYTLVGSSWTKTSETKTDANTALNGLTVGSGRGDGINRVYVLQFIGHLYEFTYNQ
jgi:hypothetical protein